MGHHVGHVTDAPVLILKSCCGNRSLGYDLLPPGAAGYEGKDYPEILICDLAGHIDNSPEFDNWRKGRDVHFWKAGEQVLVGKAVAGSVKKALEVRSKRN